ncbi:MAG: hypothetical protein LBK61_11840 [Spirochaetaceae bacterium]|nr:hypothetical protein [Spirochaetaceae bacterium]
MVNKKFWLGTLAMLLVFGMTVAGCTTTTGNVQKVGWANYTGIPKRITQWSAALLSERMTLKR